MHIIQEFIKKGNYLCKQKYEKITNNHQSQFNRDEKPFWLSFENLVWLIRAIRAGSQEFSIRGGMYGLLYIRFELFMFIYVLIMACLALPILIPLNVAAAGNAGAGFVETTATNIPSDKTSYLIAHTILTIIFVLLGLLIITWYQRMYFKTRKILHNRDFVNSHTLKINDIPKSVQQGELLLFFEEIYQGTLKSVHLAPHAPQLISLKNQKIAHLKSLAQAEFLFGKKGKRKEIRTGTCGCLVTRLGLRAKEDAMIYHKSKIAECSSKIQRRQKIEYKSSGVAFVTFDKAKTAHQALKHFYIRSERNKIIKKCSDQELMRRLKPKQWTVSEAERPQAIYWNHLSTSKYSKFIRRLITFASMIFFAFAWSIPISFLASVDTLESIPGLGGVVEAIVDVNPFFKDIIEGYIPSLLTTLLVLSLPFILIRVCMFEKPDTVGDRDASVLRLYYVFIALIVVVFPTLLIGTFDSIALLFEDGVGSVLSNINFTLQGSFFINYVIQQTFFSGMLRLCRPQHLFQRQWGLLFAVTDDEKERVNIATAHEMVYRIRFAQMLVVIACLLTFAVVVPLILPAGLLYLVVIHVIDKNNILHVFPKVLAGDNSMIISVVNMFSVALIIYQVMTAIFFYFKTSIWSFAVVIVLLALTLLVTVLLNFLNWYNRYSYIRYKQPLHIEWNLPSELLEKAYVHPGMIDEESDQVNATVEDFISGNGSITDLIQSPLQRMEEEFYREEGGMITQPDSNHFNQDSDSNDDNYLPSPGEGQELNSLDSDD